MVKITLGFAGKKHISKLTKLEVLNKLKIAEKKTYHIFIDSI